MGFINRWITAEMPNAARCKSISKIVASHGGTKVGLNLYEARELFALLLIGLALAIATFAVIDIGGKFAAYLTIVHNFPYVE
jgi:hypothetical protein